MQSAKDVAASAKAGMEKTKATMQEKAEKMTTRDPLQKEMATEKKQERISEAECGHGTATGQAAAGGGTLGGILGTGGHPTTGGQAGCTEGRTGDVAERVAEDPNVAGGARTG